jgi:hypothetical protein
MEGVHMKRQHKIRLGATGLAATALAGALLVVNGCSTESPDETETQAAATDGDGTTTPISKLPFIEATTNVQLLGQLLDKPTELGETTALHVRLPAPHNKELADSLVRVVGETTNPHVLFRSDALAELGVIPKSPGKEFFTAFATLAPEQLDILRKNQDEINSGAFGKPTNESVLFDSRTAVARTINPAIDVSGFLAGGLVPVNRCFLRPISTAAAWGKSLFITSPSVVLDGARTWDPCTGAGTQGGVWTFAHLIREMANGSGQTPEQFVTSWLSQWLNSYTVNGDVVPARTQMFNQVIAPWATASGVTATLLTNPITGRKSVSLSGPLNLNIAPYRLEAIVNRIDLGETSTGGGGLYGPTSGAPLTSGELRFIFGVVQPNPWGGGSEATCGRKLFTTIFEYGVPGVGCTAAVNWARQWTGLQAMPGFTAAYLAQLQSMTESVVLHGAAPAKGNQNAINQIRTNEIALVLNGGSPTAPWELREFTLSAENPATNSDPPASGGLRAHTVAMTVDEGLHSAAGADAAVNAFVTGIPGCDEPTVPFFVGGSPFRGGNALVGPPGGANFWRANSVPPTPDGICARHKFSLNTCHGCHHNDSGTNGIGGSTNFVHIDPLSSIPVTLSKFLTGGGPGLTFGVQDTQFPAPTGPVWQFADLERRFQRLFDISHCTSCISVFPSLPILIDRLQQIGPLPIDVNPRDFPDLKVGPVTDLGTMTKILDVRVQSADKAVSAQVDFIRPAQALSE